MYVNEFYNDTYSHHLATTISLIAGSEVVLEGEIRLAVANSIGGTISGLDPDQHVHINVFDDNGTTTEDDDLYFGVGESADASGNINYSLNVLPGHLYRVEIYPDDDPMAYYMEGSPKGTFSWGLASLVDPTTNPDSIDIQVTQGVQLSGTINGLADGQHMWVNAHCDNGTAEDSSDDFGFGTEIWGDANGSSLFSMMIPAGFIYQVCYSQDNGLTACFDGTEDGSFGHVDPNVAVNGDLILNPLTATQAVTINGTVDNLDPYQNVRIFAHSDGETSDPADDFTMEDGFDANDGGLLSYSLAVPIGYTYIVEFQPENLPSFYFQSGNINGTNDAAMATSFTADTDVYGIELSLPASGSITGQVVSDGQSLEGILVQVFADICDYNTWLGDSYTNAEGNYRIDGLAGGGCVCPGLPRMQSTQLLR